MKYLVFSIVAFLFLIVYSSCYVSAKCSREEEFREFKEE